MSFTAKDVQALREKTGCGMMDCKKALTESNGDIEKAMEFLREKGLAAAAKKADRVAAEGIIEIYVDDSEKIGVAVEVNSETDFVAKNADFKAFAETVAKIIAQNKPASVEALLALPYEGIGTVQDALREKILTIGENLTIRRFEIFEGNIASYVHGGGRIGVMVLYEGNKPESNEVVRDVAMQIAAIAPQYLSEQDIPAEVLEKEKEILIAQIKNDEKNKNKPEAIVAKMVEGRIGKFFEQSCLLDQDFVKDSNFTVKGYLEAKGKELGDTISLKKFVRMEKGEGIAKREDNLADEVAKMVK